MVAQYSTIQSEYIAIHAQYNTEYMQYIRALQYGGIHSKDIQNKCIVMYCVTYCVYCARALQYMYSDFVFECIVMHCVTYCVYCARTLQYMYFDMYCRVLQMYSDVFRRNTCISTEYTVRSVFQRFFMYSDVFGVIARNTSEYKRNTSEYITNRKPPQS